MSTNQDCSIGIAVESTYKTYVTPTRWYEFMDENLDWDKVTKQGKGLRVGARVARSGRRVVVTGEGKGDISLEVTSKGMGPLWQASLGTGTPTLVSGSTYQHNFTLGDAPNSLTIQKGVPQAPSGTTIDAYSFLGATVDSFEIDSPNGDIITAKFALDIGDYTTAQAYASPSYTATPNLYQFGGGTGVQIGGTLTAPTTTALASLATPVTTGIRNFSLSVSNNVNGSRYNYGASGRKAKPPVGLRTISGKFTAEYDQTTLRDAFLNDTSVPMVITFTSGALSTGLETFQIVLPEVKLESSIPNSNGGDLITIDHSFTVLDGLVAAQPIWLIHRTSEATL